MRNWFELLTRWKPKRIDDLFAAVEGGDVHPMDAKKRLAWEIVSIFDGDEAADQAAAHFKRVHQKRQLPEDMPVYRLSVPENVVDIIAAAELARSKSQARRLVQQGAVRIDGKKIRDIETSIEVPEAEEVVLQVGRRRFLRLVGRAKETTKPLEDVEKD
jgi:tyrosyl-tRNA synthetase